MHTFKDKEGREWTLSVNFHSLARCRDAGVDLTKPDVIAGLGDDPYQFGTALWCLVETQATERGVTPEAFAESCSDGEVVEAAVGALVAELLVFTRPARRRVVEKALAKKGSLDSRALAATEAMIESGQMEKHLEREIEAMQSRMFSTSDTPSPESSVSTPAP